MEDSKCSILSMSISSNSTFPASDESVTESCTSMSAIQLDALSMSNPKVNDPDPVLQNFSESEPNQKEEVEDEDMSEVSSNATESTNSFFNENQPPMKAVKYQDEKLHLSCYWENCSYETPYLVQFTEHVASHASMPNFEIISEVDKASKVFLVCKWGLCSYRAKLLHDLLRHVYLHAYHTKLKSLGRNSIERMSEILVCRGDSALVNVVPNAAEDFLCVWGTCSNSYVNIQEYYDHIRYHCLNNPNGKSVPGGIKCRWKDCSGTYPNITKLRDHVKSHSQEKLNACPTCGNFFSSRTRLIDHCHRQKDGLDYSCELCLKGFASHRLLRDHIRSHVNNYRCPECDMSCTSPSALAAHIKYRHSDDCPFQCSICEYSAKTNTDLRRHIKSHKSEILVCGINNCQFQARKAQTINMHQIRHHSNVDAARYLCHLCDRRYSRGYSLTRHLINTHNLQWPSGHIRFRYKLQKDGFYSLLTVRYESEVVECSAKQNVDGGVGSESIESLKPIQKSEEI